MSVRIPCPQCGAALPASPAGAKVQCPACGHVVRVPRWQGEPAAEPPEAARPELADEGSLDPFGLMSNKSLHPEDLIDMTAMVDIVFFLLIFFLVTSMQSLAAVMDMPSAHAPQSAAGKARTIAEMQADPEFLVLRIEEDDSLWIDDEQIFGEQDLGAKLRSERNLDNERRSILVVGSADASHGASVLVFDACMDAGFDDIRLSVQENLDDGLQAE